MKPLKMLSLFSGIGGIDLAAQWAGIETVAFCEIDPFCQKVLKKHWPDVPIYSDIKALRGEDVGTVDIVAGGWPCQPFSTANRKRQGIDDSRYLWPEMFRIIRETRPRWVVGENVAAIDGVALEETFSDLESIGYKVAPPFEIPALAVGAEHERYRTFIVANTSNQPKPQKNKAISAVRTSGKTRNNASGGGGQQISGIDWELSAPIVVGTTDGVPDRLDRCKALGNAVVPQQIYPIFKAIADIEEATR